MNALKKLKIGTQLSLAFGVLTALMLILAGIALTGIASIGQAVQQIDKISVDRLGPLYQAREALAQTGLAARNAYIFPMMCRRVRNWSWSMSKSHLPGSARAAQSRLR